MIKLELLELDRLEYYLLEFDQGTGRAVFSVDHIDNTKARVFGAGGRIPRIFMIGTV